MNVDRIMILPDGCSGSMLVLNMPRVTRPITKFL